MKRPSRCVTKARVPRNFAALTAVIGAIKKKAGRTSRVKSGLGLTGSAEQIQRVARDDQATSPHSFNKVRWARPGIILARGV